MNRRNSKRANWNDVICVLRQSFEIRLGAVVFSRYNGNVNGDVVMTRAAVIKEFFRKTVLPMVIAGLLPICLHGIQGF